MLSLWNQQYFSASPKLFAQKQWNFCEMVFIEIYMLKQMWAQRWQGKQKQIGIILLRHHPSVTYNPRTALKSTFDFTKIGIEWKWKRGTMCHYVRLIQWLEEANVNLSGVLENTYGGIRFLKKLQASTLQLYWGLSSFA